MPQDDSTYQAAGVRGTSGSSTQRSGSSTQPDASLRLVYWSQIQNSTTSESPAPNSSDESSIVPDPLPSRDVQEISRPGTSQSIGNTTTNTRHIPQPNFWEVLTGQGSLHQRTNQFSNSSFRIHNRPRRNYNVLPPPRTRVPAMDIATTSNLSFREMLLEYSSLRATIAQLAAGPLTPVWPLLTRSSSTGSLAQARDFQPHPRSRGAGSLLRQAYGAEAKGGTLERFMKEFEAEYRLASNDHTTAVTQLTKTSAQQVHSDSMYVQNSNFYIRNLLNVLQRYEKCATTLVERRDDFESAIPINHVRGGADTTAWFEMQIEKVEKSMRKLKKDLRSLGILKKVQKMVNKKK